MWPDQRSRSPAGAALIVFSVLAIFPDARALQIITGTPSTFTTIYSHEHLAVALHESAAKLKEHDINIKPGSTARPMTDAKGKHWMCFIPPALPDPERERRLAAADHSEGAYQGKTPFELLEKLSTLCLYRQEGLWTYEMCYKRQTRQFRPGSGEQKGEDFSCGSYKGDEHQVEEIKIDTASPSEARLRYVSHNMTGGAPCLLTGSSRTSEVRFTCQKGVTDNLITSVREFPTCNYIFTISTPFLCKHPQFKPPEEARRTFVCVPEAESHDLAPHATRHPRARANTQPHAAHTVNDITLTDSDPWGSKEAIGMLGEPDPIEAPVPDVPHVSGDGAVKHTPDTEPVMEKPHTEQVLFSDPGDPSVTLPITRVDDQGAIQGIDEDNLRQAMERAHAWALKQAEADRAAAAAATSDTPPHSTTEGSPNPNDSPADSAGLTANQPAEQLISISTNCDVTDEGQGVVGSGRVPSCRIAGLHDEQARVILEQVALGTHTAGRSPEYMTMYDKAYTEAYTQVYEQCVQQGMTETHAKAHAGLQASVHAHATALAHAGLLPPVTSAAAGALADGGVLVESAQQQESAQAQAVQEQGSSTAEPGSGGQDGSQAAAGSEQAQEAVAQGSGDDQTEQTEPQTPAKAQASEHDEL